MTFCECICLDLAPLGDLSWVAVKVSKLLDYEYSLTYPVFGHANRPNLLLISDELSKGLSASAYEDWCCYKRDFTLDLIYIVL